MKHPQSFADTLAVVVGRRLALKGFEIPAEILTEEVAHILRRGEKERMRIGIPEGCGTVAGADSHYRRGEPPCGPCNTAKRTDDRAKYRARRESGVCRDCNQRALKGKTCCADHFEMYRARERREYAKRKARNACSQCGEPSLQRTLCHTCRRKVAERRRQARETARREGRCTMCFKRKALRGYVRCGTCVGKVRAWNASQTD